MKDTPVLWRGVSQSWEVAALADIYGDGKEDIVWHYEAAGDVSVWVMNGREVAQAAVVWSGVPQVWSIKNEVARLEPDTAAAIPLRFRLIASGTRPWIGEDMIPRGVFIIDDQASWNSFFARVTRPPYLVTFFGAFDLETEMVVLISYGSRGHCPVKPHIDSVRLRETGLLEVFAETLRMPSSCGVCDAMSYSDLIAISIPRTSAPVVALFSHRFVDSCQ